MTAFSSGKLSFVNALASPYDWTDQVSMEGANPTLQAINQSHPFSLDTDNQQNPLKKLYTLIEKIIGKQPEDQPLCLILDNVSYLANSVESTQVIGFIHYCNNLIQSRKVLYCNFQMLKVVGRGMLCVPPPFWLWRWYSLAYHSQISSWCGDASEQLPFWLLERFGWRGIVNTNALWHVAYFPH